MKRCKKCGETKSLDDFYKSPGMADGYRNDCKACNLAAKHVRYLANPEPTKARVRKWQQDNPERYLEQQRRWRDSGRKARSNRKSHLKRKHGITIADYEAMLASQDGGCAICHRPPRDDISLHIDHDHETGAIRGALCFSCNNLLGDVHDDVSLLLAAAEYLWEHQHPELVSTDSR